MTKKSTASNEDIAGNKNQAGKKEEESGATSTETVNDTMSAAIKEAKETKEKTEKNKDQKPGDAAGSTESKTTDKDASSTNIHTASETLNEIGKSAAAFNVISSTVKTGVGYIKSVGNWLIQAFSKTGERIKNLASSDDVDISADSTTDTTTESGTTRTKMALLFGAMCVILFITYKFLKGILSRIWKGFINILPDEIIWTVKDTEETNTAEEAAA
ncbi:MAG: hypothetical protein GY804_09125 [Alphaproteobacteria bacterium]|nr:hypothetical protein [Alphaproteobacteria bacterium]